MPRQARLILPGIAAHIIQRGNNRDACFRTTTDYQLYLLHLRELSSKLGCAIHAYCLMTNHVHLLLTPPSADACIALMRNLGQRYVQYFNKRHDRTGTLWEGRFRSCVTESARYVLACYRYIEMNPVRAGMVVAPGDYGWSSFGINTGQRTGALVSPHIEFMALGERESTRFAAYKKLFEQEVEPSVLRVIRDSTNGGYPLGSESFKASVEATTQRRLEPGKPGRPSKAGSGKQDEAAPEIGL
jgi:putative transposase